MSRKYQILAVDQANNWIEIAGNYTSLFKVYDSVTKIPATVFNIAGSGTDNDLVSVFEVKQASTYNSSTQRTKIFTSGIRSASATGYIYNASNYSIESAWTNKAKMIIDETEVDASNLTITMHGRNSYPWGEQVWQNLFNQLENFASTVVPVRPTEGQFWYQPVEKRLRICTSVPRDANGVPTGAAAEWRIVPILGSTTYKHDQVSNSTQWVINHNLNSTDITFTVYVDIGSGVLKPIFPSDVTINSANQITLDFTASRKGKALISMVL